MAANIFELQGKSILVTGSNRGLGKDIALKLGELGEGTFTGQKQAK